MSGMLDKLEFVKTDAATCKKKRTLSGNSYRKCPQMIHAVLRWGLTKLHPASHHFVLIYEIVVNLLSTEEYEGKSYCSTMAF